MRLLHFVRNDNNGGPKPGFGIKSAQADFVRQDAVSTAESFMLHLLKNRKSSKNIPIRCRTIKIS
jgi:hypothetical protein